MSLHSQADLFARPMRRVSTPASHRDDPETCYTAEARHTRSGKRHEHQQRIAECIAALPGLTCAEIAQHTGIDYIEVNRRISEVCAAGRAERGPKRACPIRGSDCSTWWPR